MRTNVKKGLISIVGLGLMITSYGCIVEHRDDDYQRHREEYREHEEHRDDRFDRDHDEQREREEHRDYEDRR